MVTSLICAFPVSITDAESGLKNNRYRYFESARGGYSQSDPAGLGGGLNTYTYGYANPLGNIDPSGLSPIGGARVPSAHSPPPGPGGNYGRGVPSLPLPEVPVGPEQTPGAWSLDRPMIVDTARCVSARCLYDPSACHKDQPSWYELGFIGDGIGAFPTASEFKQIYPTCTCTQWASDEQILQWVPRGPKNADLDDANELITRMIDLQRDAKNVEGGVE
ncbi:RHS repeat-associated core domain-containing protein [Dyella tabacisoli]|uniref:RHS repeat-associated core domain-containing protein n=1 Tax=Dyella tabacisoli TaxID=2282381 RepID=UPI001CDC4F21|nr:RHS repeat-associated core domain-containing protein [Dyella tabacisoli]